ncbi:MAG: RES domain-containing protein [Nitrospiraceae bacterium]|nr:RES domain-containing protein [Nitrospiraceae bacterium]
MFCWRIAKEKYANSAFDGEGARRKGGRWTPKGFPAVYTAQTESLAALEQFVQLGDEGRKIRFVCFKVEIPDGLTIKEIDLASLPDNWKDTPAPDGLKAYGFEWLTQGQSAVLKVPSALISSECNFILNPLHLDFQKIKISAPEKFCYDPRMWKEE